MAYNYVVSAHTPTSVTHSITGNFTAGDQLNLLVCKGTRLEIYLLTSDGLVPLHDVPIYGRIAVLQVFRPKDYTHDLLFLTTEKYNFCVLEYVEGKIVTLANGEVKDRIGRPADIGQIGIIDPDSRVIGLHLYDGLFKVIPMNPTTGDLREAFNIRLDELQVLDIQFLHGTPRPTIAVLYQDPKEQRHVKTYEVLVEEKEFGEGPFSSPNVDPTSAILKSVRAPLGGVLVIGEDTVSYHGAHAPPRTVGISSTIMRACGMIDPTRYLLGDHAGKLYVLVLGTSASKVNSLALEELGVTSVSSCLSYLDNGVVYVGSTFGDSQLIKLNESPDEEGSYVSELDRFENLGPIVDFCVMDLEREGQGQLVTCSGAFKDGSLRIVRNGIGIDEHAGIEIPGIKGIWSIKQSDTAEFDNYLIMSFITETRFLSIGDEFEEAEIKGFDGDHQTLYCGNVLGNQLVQITERGVRLVNCDTLQLSCEWTPPSGNITVVAANRTQVLVASSGGRLTYLEVGTSSLVEKGSTTLEHEIACLDITPIGDDPDRSRMCAVGMWTDITLRVMALDSMTEVSREPIGGEIVPRSVTFVSFQGRKHLFCALGDGHLLSFQFDMEAGRIHSRKNIALATQPIVLETFQVDGAPHLFACSDRPTVIYHSNNKVTYSNVNLPEVTSMCTFHTEQFPDSLCLVSDESMTIGTIDSIQKLHIQCVPLGEMPRRIAHNPQHNALAVLTVHFGETGSSSSDRETGFLRLIDDQTFETLDSFRLDDYESGCSLISCDFGEPEGVMEKHFVAGTAYVDPDQPEPTRGRILVFSVVDHKLTLVASSRVEGAVYCLNAYNGKLLAGINSKVVLFGWSSDDRTGDKGLNKLCEHLGHILALFMSSHGDFVVVGDLMKSIMLLTFNDLTGKLEEIARDYNPNWMTAVEMLDDEVYIGAENSFNLFTVQKNSGAATDEDSQRLEVVGEFGLGEFVNRFRKGSLVMKLPDAEGFSLPTMLYGTVGGAIGVVASLREDKFNFLSALQARLRSVVKGVGGLEHASFRAFSNERKTVEMRGFVDGDLIETFLDLSPAEMKDVAASLDVTVEHIVTTIETLAQAIH